MPSAPPKDSIMFQSAPPTGVRGDLDDLDASIDVEHVSIRSPHRSEGRHFSKCTGNKETLCFNPLPPPE